MKFDKVDIELMFTKELTATFLELKGILDSRNVPFVGRKIIISLEDSLWYGMKIETKGLLNG